MTRRIAAILVACVLSATAIVTATPVSTASAVTGSQFDPGYIISDQNFFNGAAMSGAEIQSFLNSKVPVCQSGYVCLKNFTQSTPSVAADAYCRAYTGGTNESAATIIAKVGEACGISQKVILILLQKEQSLVTHTWPSDYRFTKATGYGCPDTTLPVSVDANQNHCYDANEGFFNQIYFAARQYQRYAALPANYSYRAGVVNNVLFHPNPACGSSPVFIRNQATAGLYNYTPYQPNGAALASLTGTGDSCSSYGNRNFWRLYWDWFGSPITDAALLRTSANPQVYLVSMGKKYPVNTMDTYNTLLPWGGPGFVSQGYLDGYPTGIAVGNVFRNEAGTIAMLDQRAFHPFTTCAQMSDFGSACDPSKYVQITNQQYATFTQGAALMSVIGTPSGARFAVTGGTRQELLDARAQSDAGYPPAVLPLSESAISYLPLVAPAVRENLFIRDRASGDFYAFYGGALHSVPRADATAMGLSTRAAGSLNSASLALLPQDPQALRSTVADSSGAVWSLSSGGRVQVLGAVAAGLPVVPDALLGQFVVLGTVSDGTLVKGDSSATVFYIDRGAARRISSWDALTSVVAPTTPIAVLPQATVNALPAGPRVLTSGSLVKSASDPTVYLIDGLTTKVKVRSFSIASEAGFNGYTVVSEADLAPYTVAPNALGFGYACDDARFIAAGGTFHEVESSLWPTYPAPSVTLSPALCQRLPLGQPAEVHIRVPSGAIFLIDSSGKHVYTYARWDAAGRFTDFLNVSQAFADQFPTGAPA